MERARFLAYTDGSSLSNPGGPGGIGFVVYDRTHAALRFGGKQFLEDGEAGVTNNRMELRAVLEALRGLPDGSSVELHSDSRYVIDAVSKWVHGWKKRGWRTAEGSAVLNRDLIEAIDQRNRMLQVRYQWVRGHDGHAVNEIVDGLASSAARGVEGPKKADVVEALKRVLGGR